MATVRTSAEQQSIYRFMLKSLQEYPSEAVSYLNFEVSKFDGDEYLQECYQLLSKTDRQKLYDFFNNKSSSTRSNSRTREAHYCEKPSNAYRRFATEHRSITPKSSTQHPKQIQQSPSSPNSFFTQTNELIHSWKLKQKTKNQLGIELNTLIGGCTKLSQLIEIIHSLKNDKRVMETSWDIRLIHKLLHKSAEFSDSHSSNFDGIFSDLTRFKSSYESKTCILLLKLIKLNLNFSDGKVLVLGNSAEASIMLQWGIKPNVAIYNAFITVCAKTGHFDSAWQLVCGNKPVMAPHLPLKADSITCINLLTACAEMKHYAEAKSLVLGDTATASLMQQWGIEPNTAIYNAFITVCAKTGQFDSAWRLVCGNKPVMAPHLPLKANKITCLNLLTACAEMERYAEAKSLVLGYGDTATDSLTQQWAIKPDVSIYNSFIKVCAKTGQFDSAWQLVCSDKPVMAPHLSLNANKITCMNLLTACAEARHYAEAKSLVLGDTDTASLMQQWDIKPDVAIYNAFITVCAKTGQFDSAWQLVCGDKPVMSPNLSLKANQITCMNLLTACAEMERYAEAKSLVLGDGNTAIATASLMQHWGIEPNAAIYSAFITVCAKTGQFDSAWQLVCGDKPVMAPHWSLKANKVTCLNLLTACAEARRYAEAKLLVLGDSDTATASLMQQWDIKPHVDVYNAFITVCAKTGQFDSAWQLVCGDKPVMAPHLPLKEDSITCMNLLAACAEAGRYAEAKSLVLGYGDTASLMQQWGIKSDVAIYSAFITVCAKTGQFDSAWQLVCGDKPVMAPHLPLKVDSITCLNLLTACAEAGRYAEAKSLVLGDGDKTTASLMRQWGIKPDVAIYSVFITVCAKTGQFDSAWQLVCGDKPVMAPHLPLKVDSITCINLLMACAEAGRYAEAKSLVFGDGNTATASLMQHWGIKPNAAIYNAFITVCAKTGQFDSAWQLVCGDKPVMAPNLSLKACQITCLNLLTACAETGRYAEAKSLVLDDGDAGTASLMQQWGIKPDVAIYNAFIKVCIKAKEFDTEIWYLEKLMSKCEMSTPSQIHAQLAPLEKDNFASMIDKGITQGVYRKNVGLMNHCIDLHMDKIFEEHSGNDTHIQGVPLAFAKLLFCYHKKSNETNITSIITGYHGNNTLKNGMISFLKDEFGLEFIEDKFNSGKIVLSESSH
ncbi:hypothetical protein D5R81_19090 [Parashewanella spongiae]|uniref:Uncharacterized protein n=1 Tax=Parashewanella spongiae TaxID=342950 RepID=A0A3A6TBH8_9GAMM|nr:hypothetical protein [Parashewanella spongiae]MCL1080146.1 hypothetical protein [Parashewanella spongiae]RJY04874.1 hypothetical protein D5R81_19090 [Parashewanella spongiae]